jgi:TRAP-type mannitol/chloroaromatic compound transport system permease small subunit
MWLKKAAELFDRKLRPFSTFIGQIGSYLIGVIMLLTVCDVIGRRIFRKPITGVYELSEVMLAIVVFFTLGYTESLKRHVTINILVDRFPLRVRNIIESIIYVLFLGICCILTWQLYVSTLEAYNTHQLISVMLGVPVYPVNALATLGCAVFSLNVFANFLIFLSGGIKK